MKLLNFSAFIIVLGILDLLIKSHGCPYSGKTESLSGVKGNNIYFIVFKCLICLLRWQFSRKKITRQQSNKVTFFSTFCLANFSGSFNFNTLSRSHWSVECTCSSSHGLSKYLSSIRSRCLSDDSCSSFNFNRHLHRIQVYQDLL